MQVVSSSKDLQVEAVGHQGLCNVVDLLWLLALAAALAEDDVCLDVELSSFGHVALNSNEAGFLGMLQVVPVTLGDLAVYCLLHPGNLVNELVAVVLHHRDSKAVLGVDHPDQEEPVLLQLVEGNIEHLLIVQRLVGNGDSSGGVGRGKLPGRVASDDVKELSAVPLLSVSECLPVKANHVFTERYRPELLNVGLLLESL